MSNFFSSFFHFFLDSSFLGWYGTWFLALYSILILYVLVTLGPLISFFLGYRLFYSNLCFIGLDVEIQKYLHFLGGLPYGFQYSVVYHLRDSASWYPSDMLISDSSSISTPLTIFCIFCSLIPKFLIWSL